MSSVEVRCWELLDDRDPFFAAAGHLYARTQHPDEAIPWAWIARSVRDGGRSGSWVRHLVLASVGGELAGFAYGVHLPGYGGYVCYLGVDESVRGRGVGTKLFEETFRLLADDARNIGEPLPFVVWESHRPGSTAPAAEAANWQARVRLFDRVGGLWADGLTLRTPNYADPVGPPVALQLFVLPVDDPPSAFDGPRLRAVAAGLLERVYRIGPGDPAFDTTMKAARPRLRPARDAGRTRLAV